MKKERPISRFFICLSLIVTPSFLYCCKNKNALNECAKIKHGPDDMRLAIKRGDESAVERILENGFDVDIDIKEKARSIDYAVMYDRMNIVKCLIRHHAKIDGAQNCSLWQPVCLVFFNGGTENNQLEMLKLLIDGGGSISAKDAAGTQAIHYSSENGDISIIEFLLARGAAIDAKNEIGMQPIHYAASNGGFEAVVLLLANGAKALAKSEDGSTPVTEAIGNGHLELAAYLKEQEAKEASANPPVGSTPGETKDLSLPPPGSD